MADTGMLCRATHLRDRQPVLLNVAPERCTPEFGQRIANDFHFCRTIAGPGILSALALDTFEGRPALVLEDFDGDLLAARLGQPLATGTFLDIATRITAALAAIHHCNVAHCALTPASILLHRVTGETRIIGLACAEVQPGPRHDSSRWLEIEECRPYLAPEQTGRMNRAPDMRSDLYAVGIIFHQMLTGALPFSASDLLEWVYCHIARTPPPPDRIMPSVPGVLSNIVTRLLAKDPDDRYQSADGLLRDLHACARQWECHGAIQPFALASEDVPECFRLPQRLYGRGSELEALGKAFERIIHGGAPERVLVHGVAGSGKSSLVGELRATVASNRGLFAAGKFSQERHDPPYAAFKEALAGLVQHALGESEERAAEWTRRLRQALGAHAQVIIDVLPSLEPVLGRQPPVSPHPPDEARSRFMTACTQFIRVFAREAHPLVLFLDDLQWADTESLALLEHLGSLPDLHYFLPIYAYRVREAGRADSCMPLVDKLKASQARVTGIGLGALDDDALCLLLSETLHRDRADVQPLARLLAEKTGANPFFIVKFLAGVHGRGLFEFDHALRGWRWDIEQIQACPPTDNMADVMVGRLGELLPAATQAMEHFACLGMRARADRLAIALDCTEQDLHVLVDDAIDGGLIARAGNTYSFLHERVRDAAYSFLAADDKARTHLQIGRRLLGALPAERLESEVSDVVSQFNAGIALLTDPGERELLLRLNMLAGRKAKASGAHASACIYFRHAIALLPSDAWTCRYDDALAAHLQLSECVFFVGDETASEKLCALMFLHARSDIDRASVYSLRIHCCHAAGRFEEGVTAGIEALALFGISCPSTGRAIRQGEVIEARRMAELLNGRQADALLHAPPASDRVAIAAMGLLADVLPCAYLAGTRLAAFFACRAMNLTLQYGHTEKSCFAYGSIAMVHAARGDIERGHAFSQLGLRLAEQYNDPRMRGRLLCMHAEYVSVWRDSFAVNAAVMENAFRACIDAGDPAWAGYAASRIPWQLIGKGAPLGDVAVRIEELSVFATNSRNDAACRLIRMTQQLVAGLMGVPADPVSAGDRNIEDAAGLSVAASPSPAAARYHVLAQMSMYICQRYDEALELARRLGPVCDVMMPMSGEAVASSFYHALSMAALYPHALPEQQHEFTETLRQLRDKHARWADICPANFKAPHALISAETAAVEGRDLDAMQAYEEAIRLGAEQGLVHIEALANECAARFYHARGYGGCASAYLSSAYACYTRWGAAGKLRQLETAFPQLCGRSVSAADPANRGHLAQLDALAMMKALQALSGETAFDRLLNKLLRVMIELAGAQKGYLIMPREGSLIIEAMAVLDGSGRMEIRQLHDSHVGSSFLVPASIIQYAWRTRQRVLLDNALAPSRFSSDTYILDSRPKSILCQPIFTQDGLLGLVYLENNLVSGAFSHGAVEILDMIASHAAISLETARLYSDLVEENAQRRRVEQELHHSEAHYRRLFETAKDGIMLVDACSGRIIDVNSRLILMIGCDYADLMGRSFWQTAPFADTANYQSVFERLQSEESVHHECLPLPIRDGRCLHVEFVGNAYYVGDSRMFQCNIRDITDRKRVEQQQAVQLAVTRILVESGSLADAASALVRVIGQSLGWELAEIWEVDADRLTLLSHWAAPLPGPAGAQGEHYLALPSGDDEFPRKALQMGGFFWLPGDRMSGAGHSAACAMPVRKFEDIRCVMAFYGSQPRAPEDQAISTMRMLASLIGQFIERRDIELALVRSEERFRSLAALSSAWYWEQDANLRFTHFSGGIERKAGGFSGHVLGKARQELDIDWESTDPVAWTRYEDEVRERRPFMNLEYRVMGKDGRKHWYSVSGEPVFDAKGLFHGYRGAGNEITERKEGEALQARQALALEMIATGAALESVLVYLARIMEGRSEGLCVAILRLDDNGRHIDVAAAPSMPASFREQLADMHAGPESTTFGAAMARRERVVIFDLAQDTHDAAWTEQRDAALRVGFHACCSTPILSQFDAVLGSFDIYWRDARRIEEVDLRLADSAARIAGIAIERGRREGLSRRRSRHDDAADLPALNAPAASLPGKA